MHRVLRLAFLALLALVPRLAFADSDPPEKVVADWMRAASKQGPAALVDYYAPASLERFKGMVLTGLTNGGSLVSPMYGGVELEEAQSLEPRALFIRVSKDKPNPPATEFKVLGSVPDGEDVVHVVVRLSSGSAAKPPTVDLVTVRRVARRWYVDMPELLVFDALSGLGDVLGEDPPANP